MVFLGILCFARGLFGMANARASQPWTRGQHTVGANAKKHPASFQGTLGFFISQGFTMKSKGLPRHKSVGTLGIQGWVSCGRFLVAELPLDRSPSHQ